MSTNENDFLTSYSQRRRERLSNYNFAQRIIDETETGAVSALFNSLDDVNFHDILMPTIEEDEEMQFTDDSDIGADFDYFPTLFPPNLTFQIAKYSRNKRERKRRIKKLSEAFRIHF